MISKKILVSGGAGFIGAHLVRALLKDGHQVVVVDNLSTGKKERIPDGVSFHLVDITDLDSLKPLLVGVEAVFHLAALPRVSFSIDHPIESNEANVKGTLNLLVSAKDAGVKIFVYSASSSAYGDQDILPLVETMPARPKSPYGLQKYIGELYAKTFTEIYGLPTVCLRYFNVYGPGDSAEASYPLVITKFIKQRQNNEPLTICGSGEQTRDFTHVTDIVRANLLCLDNLKIGRGEVVNIGAGNNQSVKRIAELVGGPVEFLPARLEPKDTKADNSKAKELLGWEPQVSIEEGINELKQLAGLL
ncbi:MAG: NAD-dependent epimerase/dehydratase family protein [Candidatus Vogelbacteria bacterium]|nr:NAD-dependent epimerase/dehydratase family protein [Candidatus Vogelbacteria bacterium]